MKSFLSSSLGLAALLAAVLPAPSAQAQSTTPSPYLEVVSLTFLWNTVDTYITRTTVPAGTSPGTGLDPSLYDPTKPISVETGNLGVLNTDGINQDVLVQHLAQALIRSKRPIALVYNEETQTVDEVEQGLRTPYIGRKEALGSDIQILAIREAPRTIEEFATKPYSIYLSVLDRTDPDWLPLQLSSIPVDPYSYEYAPDIQGDLIPTGLSLELGQWSASGTIAEKLSSSAEDAVLNGASGKITVAFKLKYGAAFYDDPRHNAKDDAEIHEYHLKRHLWNIEGSGHLVFNLGSVNSPSSSTVPGGVAKITGASLTGTGWFSNANTTVEIKDEAIYRITGSGSDGLAPVRIVMNNFQYQNRNMFAYYPPLPLESLDPAPAP